ncbi:MAG: acyl-CoA synthetase [Comamonas sp.]
MTAKRPQPPPESATPANDAPPAMHWAHQRERSAAPVVRFMAWLSITLGRRLSRVLVYGIAAYFFAFAPKARAASRAYLRRVLNRPITARDGYRHVLSFASCIHDRVYWLRGHHDLFDVEIQGVEHVLAACQPPANDDGTPARGQGVVFVGAHLGSFEALRMLGETHGLKVRMLMYPDNAQKINAVLAAINPSLQDSVIALGRADSLLTVRDCLQRGECVGALADRQLKQEPGVVFDFLGSKASFPEGPFRMAALLKTRVVFMAGLYLGSNRYRIEFLPVADFSDTPPAARAQAIEAAQTQYVRQLEAVCRRAPMNWFNFYDFWHEEPH